MSGVLDLFGDGEDDPVSGLPFLVYRHYLNLGPDARHPHQWSKVGESRDLVEAQGMAEGCPTHCVVYQGGLEIHSNLRPPIELP